MGYLHVGCFCFWFQLVVCQFDKHCNCLKVKQIYAYQPVNHQGWMIHPLEYWPSMTKNVGKKFLECSESSYSSRDHWCKWSKQTLRPMLWTNYTAIRMIGSAIGWVSSVCGNLRTQETSKEVKTCYPYRGNPFTLSISRSKISSPTMEVVQELVYKLSRNHIGGLLRGG